VTQRTQSFVVDFERWDRDQRHGVAEVADHKEAYDNRSELEYSRRTDEIKTLTLLGNEDKQLRTAPSLT
jgi:hypothetical protein